jgi:hypothetical protein
MPAKIPEAASPILRSFLSRIDELMTRICSSNLTGAAGR